MSEHSGADIKTSRSGRSKTVQSVDRAVALMRTLADSDTPLSLKALAASCELETATTWRLLWTLQTHGLVEKADPTPGYRLGVGVLELLGSQVIDSLAVVGRPLLERLAADHGVTASLGYVERFSVVYIDQVDSPRFRSPDWKGQAASMYATSPGKAVLATMSKQGRRILLGTSLPALTDTTITDLDDLEADMARTRELGYAECRGEDVAYSYGVSAAVFFSGRVVAVINLWGPERLVPPERFPELGSAVVSAAREMESILRHNANI
ncbi:MAG TPA: IclR family transcriptional regulator [Pseudonocardiaceae bacterium]